MKLYWIKIKDEQIDYNIYPSADGILCFASTSDGSYYPSSQKTYVDNEILAIDRILTNTENKASILTFKLFPTNNGPNIERFVTKVEAYDRNKKIFTGRVIDIESSMTSEGKAFFKVTCESVLNYLNDSLVGKWAIHPGEAPEEDENDITEEEKKNDPFTVYENMNVEKFLSLILENHNSKVKEDKKILKGTVTVEGNIYCYTNRETSLNAILDKLVNRKGGFLNIREVFGVYYLDYLKELSKPEGNIELSINMKALTKKNSNPNIYTRIIPIGADGLGIKDINNDIDYVEDKTLVERYGVIEGVVEFEDVTLPENLLKKAQEELKNININSSSLELSAIDLSYLDDEIDRLQVSQVCRIFNKILGIDEKQRIIEVKIYMDEPYNNTFTISNSASKATTVSNKIIQEFQNSKVEMAIINDKLISKITKGQAMSLIQQTANEILLRVEEGEKKLSAQIKINADAIEQRVKSAELESIVTQNAESWNLSINGKLEGKTYKFDGNGFTLGSTSSGNTAVHTNEYSRWNHSTDGYSEANSQGFYRNGRPYHNLIEIGQTITGGSAGVYPKTVTIQLSDQFKNKKFKAIVSVVDFSGSGEQIEYLKRLHLNIDSYDYTNAKITVTGYWTSIRDNAGAIIENEKELQWSYVVIGG